MIMSKKIIYKGKVPLELIKYYKKNCSTCGTLFIFTENDTIKSIKLSCRSTI